MNKFYENNIEILKKKGQTYLCFAYLKPKTGTDLVFKQNYSRVFSEALKKLDARAN